jgi:ribosomal protein S18 acetylase RimI-like enzyme
MIIRQMQPSDLDFAVTCTAAEGWITETREVFEDFLSVDPEGCFVAKADGAKIGMCTAVTYADSGFFGELIVVEPMRGRGIGRELLEHAIDHLHRRGVRNILLDGVVAAVPLYERVGFRKVCRSLRFAGKLTGRAHARVRGMQPADLQTVGAIDRAAFGADRLPFLRRRLAAHPELCNVLEHGGQLAGFVMGRPAPDVVSVGPWVVLEGVPAPQRLLENLAVEAGDSRLHLGILETNAAAIEAVRSLGFEERPQPPWRMVLGHSAALGASEQCYAIGSAAKG